MKINYQDKKFEKLLLQYIKWIDEIKLSNTKDYENERKKLHNKLFEYFKIKRLSPQGEQLELYINKAIFSLSKSKNNKTIALINSCKSQSELDLLQRKLDFIEKFNHSINKGDDNGN